jgi:hypothetical protein
MRVRTGEKAKNGGLWTVAIDMGRIACADPPRLGKPRKASGSRREVGNTEPIVEMRSGMVLPVKKNGQPARQEPASSEDVAREEGRTRGPAKRSDQNW